MPPKDYKAGMDDIERNNFDVLKQSNKKWTDDEAGYLATNPSGRLHPEPNSLKSFYQSGKTTPDNSSLRDAVNHTKK